MKRNVKILKILLPIVLIFIVWVVIMALTTPKGVFRSVYSTLLYSSNGTLMNAHIASDGQWRFPPSDTVPEKFRQAILNYEDRWFYWHPGVNPVSMVKAAMLNFRRGRIVSGGSTLTMQVSRISSESRERTYWRKFVELNRALYIELCYSKNEILAMYASHAPFGGNVVGLEAASWRYFSCPASQLTWAQAAMLAVLPNSPSLVHISRNRELLLKKRNSLLHNLFERGLISEEDYTLAVAEPIPAAPENLPQTAPHLASTMLKKHRGEAIHTHIDIHLQNTLQNMADQYAREYTLRNQLHNIAILVQEVPTGNTVAYVGNASFKADERFCNSVDIITSPRSTGSILKPVLYAAMLTDGMILPHTLIPDVPLYLKGFNPQNYNKGYSGVVHADEAVIRSLNVPLVRMLRDYGIDRFLKLLRSLGITTMNRDADHYGASLILGGAEATLQEICNMYGTLARALLRNNGDSGHMSKRLHPRRRIAGGTHRVTDPYGRDEAPIRSEATSTLQRAVRSTNKKKETVPQGTEPYDVTDVPISQSSLWFMFETMSKLNRPEEEADWQQFESMKKIAWKTGTSYGGKDAWAIGVTPQYVVGVWVGNATGEGRSGMTGVGYAAPVMLRAFSHLRTSAWFEPPYDDMAEEAVCRASGHRASEYCTEVDTVPIPHSGVRSDICPYHKLVHLNKERTYRVNSSCYGVSDMINEPWFVLPPVQEYYYKLSHINYRQLPPMMPGCDGADIRPLDIIYPNHGAILYTPVDFEGKKQSIVCEATHHNPDATIYWHLDNEYLGSTQYMHSMAIQPAPGTHTLTIVDDAGNRKAIQLTVNR